MKGKQFVFLLLSLVNFFGIYWINAGKTSLKTVAEVATRGDTVNYALPPGFVFSIWGIIYLGFLFYNIYRLKPRQTHDIFFDGMDYWVAISVVFNLLWVTLTGMEYWFVAYLLQWVMLAIAIRIMYYFVKGRSTKVQKWISVPFALYAGWLTTAMIPFTADLLNKTDWNFSPFNQKTWTIIIYVAAFLIVAGVYRRLKQPVYLLPLAWAFAGLAIKFDGAIRITAAVLSIILRTIFFLGLRVNKYSPN